MYIDIIDEEDNKTILHEYAPVHYETTPAIISTLASLRVNDYVRCDRMILRIRQRVFDIDTQTLKLIVR